jgi:hypothetical protein
MDRRLPLAHRVELYALLLIFIHRRKGIILFYRHIAADRKRMDNLPVPRTAVHAFPIYVPLAQERSDARIPRVHSSRRRRSSRLEQGQLPFFCLFISVAFSSFSASEEEFVNQLCTGCFHSFDLKVFKKRSPIRNASARQANPDFSTERRRHPSGMEGIFGNRKPGQGSDSPKPVPV